MIARWLFRALLLAGAAAFAPPAPCVRARSATLQLAAAAAPAPEPVSLRSLARPTVLSRRVCAGLIASGTLALLPRESWAAPDADTAKLIAGYEALEDLIENWERYAGNREEVKGDSVRRQIGTVGSKSPLVGIRKVLLKKSVDLDQMEDFGKLLTSIDANAYASIFATSGKKRGYMFMEDAFKDCKELRTLYAQILESLDIEVPSQ